MPKQVVITNLHIANAIELAKITFRLFLVSFVYKSTENMKLFIANSYVTSHLGKIPHVT